MFLAIIFLLIFIVWFYVMWGRDIVRARLSDTNLSRFMTVAETLWMQSRTVLVGRMYWLIGVIMALHEMAVAAGFDFTPIYGELANLFPAPLRPFIPSLLIYGTGILIVKLRKMTMEDTEKKGPDDAINNR